MLKRIYEVDPLICSECGSRMTIIGFGSEGEGIRGVLESPGLREEKKPPVPARPPPELAYELLPGESDSPEELRVFP